MAIEVTASGVVPRKIGEVFEEAAAKAPNLARYFTGLAPLIPAIVDASIDGDGVMREGALRSVKLSDGTRIRERILGFEAPRLHRYDMAEMNPLQRAMCTNMVSEWRFEEAGDSTRVVWTYAIHPKGPLTRPLAWAVSKLFRRAMQRCIDNLARDLGPRP